MVSSYWSKRDARTTPGALSKRGSVYQASIDRSIGNGESASAQFRTGNAPTVVYLREIASTADSVRFTAYTVTATSGASGSVQGFNLNQTITGAASVSQAVLSASVSSASVVNAIVSDIVPGGSKNGGAFTCSKVRTLAPDTTYLFVLNNLGNNATIAHVSLVWSENEPEPYKQID